MYCCRRGSDFSIIQT